MKITLDTNVLISSTMWDNSVAFKLLKKLIENEEEIFTTADILDEYQKVLKRDFKYTKEETDKISTEVIIRFLKIVEINERIDEIKEDPTDNKILECAVESNSEYILSYDKHLLNIKEFRGIKIITPEEYLEILKIQ